MKNYNRVIAATLAVLISAGSTSVFTVTAVDSTESTTSSSSSTSSSTSSEKAKQEKSETVYIITDANGNTTKTIVTDWLKNPKGIKELADVSDLSKIENVKTNEKYTQNGKNLTWNTTGGDIYYKGYTDKAAPVTMKITYKLDGKEVNPKDIIGKSGKLTVRYDYTNNEKKTVTVNGKEYEVYVPFVMATTTILETSKYSNVVVKNGKLISDGSKQLLIGAAMPGLKQSLNLSDKIDIDIPEYVEFTADVKDFEMKTQVSVATNSLLNEVDFDNIKSKTDLDSKLKKLKTSTQDLVDGTSELYSGIKKLSDKSGTLTSGINTLNSGAKTLSKGAATLESGAKKLTSGAKTLDTSTGTLVSGIKTAKSGSSALLKGFNQVNSGVTSLSAGTAKLVSGTKQTTSGAKTLQSGAKTLATGSSKLSDAMKTASDGSTTLKNGTAKLYVGTVELADGITKLHNNSAALNTGASTAASGAKTLSAGTSKLTTFLDANSATSLAAGAAAVSAGVDKVSAGVSQIKSGVSSIDLNSFATKLNAIPTNLKTLSDGMATAAKNLEQTIAVNEQVLKEMDTLTPSTTVGAMKQQLTATIAGQKKILASMSTDNDASTTTLKEGLDALYTQTATSIPTALKDFNDKFTKLNAGLDQLTDEKTGLPALSTGAAAIKTQLNVSTYDSDKNPLTFKAALESVNTGAASLSVGLNDSTKGLASGVKAYTGGVDQIYTSTKLDSKTESLPLQVKQISDGAAALATGNYQIYKSSLELASGAKTLSDGSITLTNGLITVQSGAVTLNSGVATLKSGCTKLSDGTKTLDSGLTQLSSGGTKLKAGTNTLYSSLVELAEGTTTLSSGSAKLFSGVGTLKSGATTLVSGVGQLKDGSENLKDGMAKYQKDGIDKLLDIYNDDIKGLVNRLKALKQASDDYNTFSGKANDVDGKVKFIYETAASEKDKK